MRKECLEKLSLAEGGGPIRGGRTTLLKIPQGNNNLGSFVFSCTCLGWSVDSFKSQVVSVIRGGTCYRWYVKYLLGSCGKCLPLARTARPLAQTAFARQPGHTAGACLTLLLWP